MKRLIASMAACVIACALAMGVLAGCSPASSNLTAEQQANRAYMSQVNGVMSELGTELESFVAAVSRGDLVNMRTQADNAYKKLDTLSSIEAPEAFTEVQKQYVDGAAKMKEALDAYIKLYTDVSAGSFDQSTYASRLANVQSLYDEGVSILKKADETAASK